MTDVAARTEDFIEFCAGAGQLGEGVRMAIESAWTARAAAAPDDDAGGVGRSATARPVCYVEIDLAPALLIAARIRDGALPDAPLWSNLKSFDARAWRGHVDGIIGGYPCQPFSAAGKRLGVNDPRHLWPWIIRHIRSVGPRWCFFENVGEHLRIGYHDVVRPDLARAGYRVEEILLKASDVGAPHSRERLFILAVANAVDDGLDGREQEPRSGALGRAAAGGPGGGSHKSGVADTDSLGRRALERGDGGGEPDIARRGEAVAYADRRGLGAVAAPAAERSHADDGNEGVGNASDERYERSGPARGGWDRPADAGRSAGLAHSGGERPQGQRAGGPEAGAARRGGGADLQLAYGSYGGWPPGPGDAAAWQRILSDRPELAPATQSPVRGGTHGLAGGLDFSRADRLRIIGNGVVTLQVAEAFRLLADELGLEL